MANHNVCTVFLVILHVTNKIDLKYIYIICKYTRTTAVARHGAEGIQIAPASSTAVSVNILTFCNQFLLMMITAYYLLHLIIK